MLGTVLFCLLSFLFGGIPFGIFYAKKRGIDLKTVGSGNIGATNVYRALGLKPAIVVFVLDLLKGLLPVLLAIVIFDLYLAHVAVAFMAVMGHSFSPFLKFKGGKSAATGVGTLIALSPFIGILIILYAIVVIKVVKIVSVASVSSCLMVPFLFYGLNYPSAYVVYVSLAALFVIIRHKDNIVRLINGTEKQIHS